MPPMDSPGWPIYAVKVLFAEKICIIEFGPLTFSANFGLYPLVGGNSGISAHQIKSKILTNYPYCSNFDLNSRKIRFFEIGSQFLGLFVLRLSVFTH